MSNNFYLSLRTQYENLGDYLIAQATIDLLSEFGNIVLDIRNVPEKYFNLFTLPKNTSIVKKDFMLTVLLSKQTKWFYVVKPGGHSCSQSLQQKLRTFFMASYFSIAKKMFAISVLKMPHSFNGEVGSSDQFYQQQFDLNLCRDQKTFNSYQKNDINNLYLFPDMATYYFDKKSKFAYSKEVDRKNIAVSLRFDRLSNESTIAVNLANQLLAQEALKEILFVTQVTLDTQINTDISHQYDKRHIQYNMTQNSIEDIIQTYKSSKYVISNRLHALLLGLINGAIPIALIDIQKDQKILGCLDFLNIPWIDKENLENNDIYFSKLKSFETSISNNLFDMKSDLKTIFEPLIDNKSLQGNSNR